MSGRNCLLATSLTTSASSSARVAARPHQAHFHPLDEALVRVEGRPDVDVSHHHHRTARLDHLDGRFDQLGVRAEDHHSIRPLAAGDVAHFLDEISRGVADRVLGAVPTGHFQLGLD